MTMSLSIKMCYNIVAAYFFQRYYFDKLLRVHKKKLNHLFILSPLYATQRHPF